MRRLRALAAHAVRGALVASVATTLSASTADAAGPGPRDFEGTWILTGGGLFLGVDLPYTPAGQDLTADRLDLVKAGHSMASPHLTCRPTGTAGIIASKTPFLILQTPQTVYVVTQEDREVRFIHMDRGHPADLKPSYSGDSIGRWDGDTLVVDTVGFNGRGQIDEVGNPQSAQAHIVERWTRNPDGKSIDVKFTFTDPVYFTRPFEVDRAFKAIPGARIGDYDCAENPRADDFDNLTFRDETLRPVCVRPVANGIAAAKVVCTPPPAARAGRR